MKPLLTAYLFLAVVSFCFAQNDLFPADSSEINYQEGIAYYHGSPFTGVLIDKKTSKKIGEYRNGSPNGMFIEYFTKTKKKNEGKYVNGLKEGTYSEWFLNGNKKSECNYVNGQRNGIYNEWYENKQLKSTFSFDHGKIVDGTYVTFSKEGRKDKEETYKGGEKIKEGIYKEGQFYELSVKYYAESNAKESEGYLKDGKKDGLWKQWYATGEISSSANYKEGKEDGIWTWWYSNGDKKKEAKYENGNLSALLFENNVDPSTSINTKFRADSYLFKSLSNVDEDTSFVMVSFNFDKENTYRTLVENIIKSLSSRFNRMLESEIPYYGKKMLGYSIEFANPQVSIEYDNGVSTTSLGILGKLQIKTSPGYRGKASVYMEINNLKNSSTIFSNTIENQSDKYNNQNDAYVTAPSLVSQLIINQVFHSFKIKKIVKEILEGSDNEAETIGLAISNNQIFPKGSLFYIYAENNLNDKLGEVEVTKTENNMTICEVNEGGKLITSAMHAGQKLVAISKY